MNIEKTRFVYADNAATTPVSKPVLDAMLPYFSEHYGNPSSIYSISAVTKSAVEEARAKVAAALGAEPREIYFTSGGSEGDNWAIKLGAELKAKNGRHIITTAFEHHAVLHTMQYLEKHGYEVTYLPVGSEGVVSVDDLKAAIRPDTILISVMFANNEIGTIQPIAEIGAIAHEHGILFHTDAVQAVGNVEIDVKAMHIDMLSMSAHKIHGPKGVGAMYIRKGLPIDNLIHGGGQERSRRAGTENVAGIVGLGVAIERACADIPAKAARIAALRDKLIDGVLKIPYTRLNGHREKRLPGNANFSIQYIEGEAILLSLDLAGICASSGSACTSGSLDPSHVLLAIGLPHEIAHGSLRITLSEDNTEEDVDYILETLPKVVDRLRAMSPLYEKVAKAQ